MDIFKNKSIVRLFAFLTACIIISVLLLSGLNVCAENNSVSICEFYQYSLKDMGYSKCWNVEDYMQSSIYNPNYTSVSWGVVADTTSIVNLLDGDDSNGELKLPSSFSVSGQTYNLSDFPYFAIFYNDASSYAVYLYPSYSVNHIYSRGQGCSLDSSFLQDKVVRFTCTADGWYGEQAFVGTGTINDGDVPIYINPSNDKNCYCCNFEVSAIDTSFIEASGHLEQIQAGYLQYWFALNNVGAYGVSSWGNYNDYFIPNINYIADGYYNPITNETIGGSGGSSGDATNNMYFKNFNISYSVSGLKDGNVVCYGDLNDYQKEHLDEFALTYSFNFEYYAYNPVVTGYKYNFTKNYSYQQTLSDFYNNGSSKVFTLKEIMQNINTQDIDSEYGNLYQLISYLSNTGNNENIEYTWSKAKMKTTVFIVSASDSPSDILNNSNLHSNSFSKGYNFLDGKSSTYSDGITSNNNPYQTSETGSISDQNELNNMPNGVSSSNIPSSQGDNGGSGTSVVTGDNNIVINNNPTFNNDGSVSGSGGGSSDGGVASTFYNTFNPFKTLFSSLNGDNSVISDDTAETIGSNRFISVMSSTFSFIPEGMWTALTTFLIASLSILIVAVVIRVLLDLL